MRYPYDIFESLFGAYNPEKPSDKIFSVWFIEMRREYYKEHPEEVKNQMDNHMYETARNRFFAWLDKRYPVTTCEHRSTTFGNCNDCGQQSVFTARRGLTRPEHKPLCHSWFKSS